ncbi:hypothetical protein [Pseudomonas lopnurensis]|uniref:hypothetical protein n=1 Tax=Pseudomonas lopnurensis TaxID=1477517 RepID=UPI0028AF08F4|nr:hypothetical protein [Pseudomonas lopnurensis]
MNIGLSADSIANPGCGRAGLENKVASSFALQAPAFYIAELDLQGTVSLLGSSCELT